MKIRSSYIWIVLAVVLFFCPLLGAQEQTKFAAAGLSFNQAANPNIQGWFALAIPLSSSVLSYTVHDVAAIPQGPGLQGFLKSKLESSTKTGLMLHVYDPFKGFSLWGLGAGGIATDGSTVGGSFAGGGMLDFAISKDWGAVLILQVDKSSITGAQFTPRAGIRRKL